MKRKHILLILFALASAIPVHAGGYGSARYRGLCYYGTVAYTPSHIASLRVGLLDEEIGGEIYVKSDFNRLGNDVLSRLDGTTYRLSVMGGLTYWAHPNFMLIVNMGYGYKGTYMVDASFSDYGVTDLKKGFEVGLGCNLVMGRFMFYAGYTGLAAGKEMFYEYALGIGLKF